jgi:fibronectin type 3 domain-containing protein
MTPIIRGATLAFIAASLAGNLYAQSFIDLGSSGPTPGPNDISQLSTSGNTTWPDGINYFTDNNPPPGQTFTTGTSALKLVSVAIKTAGLNSGGGYGTPTNTPTYYLRIYSMSGSTATLLNTFSAPNPGFTDGDWLQWGGLNVSLGANQTYAFSFGIQPTGGGYAALAVAMGAYAGGEIVTIPISGGTVTTGGSHSYDAVFDLGLQAVATNIPASMPLPNPCYGWNTGNSLEATWGYAYPSQAVFTTAANAGFNAVRIPCAWGSNATTNGNTYPINPTYMAHVKQAVDYAIATGMYVVINDHWDGGWLVIGTNVDSTINAKMNSYWTQIATTFAGYDNHLLFAAANEPTVGNPTEMATLIAYYQTFVNAVRGVGGNNTNRWLVLQGGGDVSWLNSLPTDSTPNRLMVEYHCYTPFLFTQAQSDQSYGNMIYFWGPAYHYSGDPTRNATSPEEGDIDSGCQELTDQYVSKGIPVMVGEFQAAGKSVLSTNPTEAAWNSASAYYWNKYVLDSAHAHGLSPFYWSTPNSPFVYNTGAITDTQVVSVLTGGVAPPPPNGAPYAASGLTATNTGNGQITLSWTAGSGAKSYKLYRAAESGYESCIAPFATGITGTSYTDTGLNGGTTYYYQVVAANGSGPTGFSPEAYATTPGINPDPAQFNFETDPQDWFGGGGIISGVATSTTQHYAGNQSLAVNFNGTGAGSSSVSVGGVVVPAGKTITFHVWIPGGSQITTLQPYLQDYNWGWTSGWFGSLTANAWNTITLTVPSTAIAPFQSLGITFTTSAGWMGTAYIDSVSWPVSAPTAAPTGLGATGGSGVVNLNWTQSVSPGITGNNVYRSTTGSGGPYNLLANLAASTSYSDTAVAAGSTYYYGVTAVSSSGESAMSAYAGATTIPAAPTGLAANAGNAQVALSWTATTGASSYKVKRATVSGGPYTTIATGVTSPSYTNTSLTNGTTYYYVVSAVNGSGESANSAQVSATPSAPAGPAAPTSLAASSTVKKQIKLTWTQSTSPNITNNKIYRATRSGGPYTLVTTVSPTTSYNDTGLNSGTTYYYVVTAVNSSSLESPYSNQASVAAK